jgi:hypothetical protein
LESHGDRTKRVPEQREVEDRPSAKAVRYPAQKESANEEPGKENRYKGGNVI